MPTLEITDIKLYVQVVATPDNAKLHENIKSDFKLTTNWNKYMSMEGQNQYLENLIDPSYLEFGKRRKGYLKVMVT